MGYFDLYLLACCLDQFAKLDAGGTGRFAGPAAKATIDMLNEIWGNFQAAVGNCLHLVNTSARGIHLYAQYRIGWARWQTKTTVDTLANQFIRVGLAA